MTILTSIPSPDVSYVQVWPFQIPFYALFILTGIVVAVLLTSRRLTAIESAQGMSRHSIQAVLDQRAMRYPQPLMTAGSLDRPQSGKSGTSPCRTRSHSLKRPSMFDRDSYKCQGAIPPWLDPPTRSVTRDARLAISFHGEVAPQASSIRLSAFGNTPQLGGRCAPVTRGIKLEFVMMIVTQPAPASRWINVTFLQGRRAEEVLAMIDRSGPTAAIEYLQQWDLDEVTTDAALTNGYVYDRIPAGSTDRTLESDGSPYALTYSPLLAAVLTGCAVSPARTGASDTSPTTASAAPSAAAGTDPAEHGPRLSDLAPGTIIATGEFSGSGTTGSIQITANGADHGFDVTLTGIQPIPLAGTSLELNALPPTASETDMQHGFSYYGYDQLSQTADQTFSTPTAGLGGFDTTDPRYMRTAVIWTAPSGAPIGLGNAVATAALTWDLPNMKANPEVTDHGLADGAHGQATVANDGTPVNYRIAPNDTANGIAARFGITTDTLEWLNPDRFGERFILANITINLSGDSRGLR